MIIVEGMDNTGKTTLVEKLKTEFELEPVRSPGPKPYRELFEFVDKYASAMEEVRSKQGTTKDYPFIHDRFPIFSDRVYGAVLRKINPFEELDEGRWLVERIRKVGAVVIYCRPQRTEKILSFEDGRKQMDGVEENAKRLLEVYDNTIFQWSKKMAPTYRYCYDNDRVEDVISWIKGRGW